MFFLRKLRNKEAVTIFITLLLENSTFRCFCRMFFGKQAFQQLDESGRVGLCQELGFGFCSQLVVSFRADAQDLVEVPLQVERRHTRTLHLLLVCD